MAHTLFKRRQTLYGILLLAILAMSSCGGPYNSEPPEILTLPTLRAPGLTKLALFSNLRPGFFSSLTIAQVPGSSSPLILVAIGVQLYVSHLDGSGQHAISLGSSECGDPSFTNDLRWVACSYVSGSGDDSTQSNDIFVASLHNTSNLQASDEHFADLWPDIGSYSNPYWEPNGKGLAILSQSACVITLYRTTSPYKTFSLWETLSYSQNYCDPAIPTDWWSPDGRYFLAPESDDWYLVPVSYLLNPPVSSPETAGTLPPPANYVFSPFTHVNIVATTWGPAPQEITYVVNDQATGLYDVRSINILTRKQRDLFSIPPTSTSGSSAFQQLSISSLAWTPDDRHLIFSVVNADPCVDCNAYYQAQLYSYTPTA